MADLLAPDDATARFLSTLNFVVTFLHSEVRASTVQARCTAQRGGLAPPPPPPSLPPSSHLPFLPRLPSSLPTSQGFLDAERALLTEFEQKYPAESSAKDESEEEEEEADEAEEESDDDVPGEPSAHAAEDAPGPSSAPGPVAKAARCAGASGDRV